MMQSGAALDLAGSRDARCGMPMPKDKNDHSACVLQQAWLGGNDWRLLTFPVTGACPAAHAHGGTSARVRVDRAVSWHHHALWRRRHRP